MDKREGTKSQKTDYTKYRKCGAYSMAHGISKDSSLHGRHEVILIGKATGCGRPHLVGVSKCSNSRGASKLTGIQTAYCQEACSSTAEKHVGRKPRTSQFGSRRCWQTGRRIVGEYWFQMQSYILHRGLRRRYSFYVGWFCIECDLATTANRRM